MASTTRPEMKASELLDSDRAILDVLREGRATPAYLIERTPFTKQTVHNRLNVLVAAGHVDKVTDGLYELAGDPRDTETDARQPADATETPTVDDQAPDAGLEQLVDDVARDWQGEHVGDRRDAARAALEWLRSDGGPASGSDFKAELLTEYAVGGQSPDTWWRKTVRPVLQAAADAGLVEYRSGYHDYRWGGDE